MSESRDDTGATTAAIDAERRRLDLAILGFNRHALLAERHRRLVERYQDAREAFSAARATHEAVLAAALRDREQWRAARVATATHRDAIRMCVRRYVHQMRDGGLAPERALILVKQRLVHCVTATTPAAPSFDARTLETDVSTWAIDAYYEAA